MNRETKSEKFRRLAEKRVTRVLDEIRKISNLSSNNYEFSREQVERIFSTIRERLDQCEQLFLARLSRGVSENFHLNV